MPTVPFRIDIPSSEVDDLRRRLRETRLPEPLKVPEPGNGIKVMTLQRLLTSWRDEYDWYAHQDALNAYPQLRIDIDSQSLHAVHVRSDRSNSLPLLLLHGWPSTFVEYVPLVDSLTRPADPGDVAFDVVVPSLPGFGFSGATLDLGWNNPRMAKALAELMARLGYDRYIIHGSDVGQFVGTVQASMDAEHVLGIHLNMGGIKGAGENLGTAPLDDREQFALDKYQEYMSDKLGYAVIQATRPETLAYALTDSPVGQLAWIAEKFYEWGDPEHLVSDEHILTTASIYWFTRTAGSAGRFYREEYAVHSPAPYVQAPTAVGVYPHDLAPAVRRWAERDYNITQWTEMPCGGHFAALEAPQHMLASLRQFGASLVT